MSAKKEHKSSILDLSTYLQQPLIIKFHGNRQVTGTLKGFDPLQNLVLDDTVENVTQRQLGLVVCRGPAILAIYPQQGSVPIDNPFQQQ